MVENKKQLHKIADESDLLMQVMNDISSAYPAGNIRLSQARQNAIDAMHELGDSNFKSSSIDILNNFLISHRADKITCIAAWALFRDYVQNKSARLFPAN